jgi:riboflavin kinase/FMN adenylyltransferase
MQVVRNLETLAPDTPYALTVGVFDGVHRGHHYLIQQTARAAANMGGKAGMVTFWPHPLEVLRPTVAVRYLTLLEEKLDVLAALGTLDTVVVMPFTPALSQTSASDFIDLLRRHLNLQVLVEGSDFVFGHNRQGDMGFLTAYGEQQGFAVENISLQLADQQRISSTRIRALLAEGQVEEAAALLGRAYSARGLVVKGDQRGRLLGFPTANLEIDTKKILPADGVYAVRAAVGDEVYNGVTNIGWRPTVDGTRHVTETHLFDVQPDLYGKTLEVQFIARLREERRFAGIEALKAQIAEDAQQARLVLERKAKGKPERGESGERTLEV